MRFCIRILIVMLAITGFGGYGGQIMAQESQDGNNNHKIYTDNKFRKDEFLRNCGFSVEGNKLSDQEEYDLIHSDSSVLRGEKTQNLYERFNRTRDYETNLEICRELSLGLSMRNYTGYRGTDSLLIDNFFARAIERTEDKGVLVRLMLGYANDKSYSVQGVIGEECLKPECFVNDSLRITALGYAIDDVERTY